MFISLSVSLNGKAVTLHETNNHYKAYLQELLNYGSDASDTYLVSSFWYLDLSGELKDNSGYATCLNWTTQFLMAAYDGVCSPNVSVRMVRITFSALPCRKKKTW